MTRDELSAWIAERRELLTWQRGDWTQGGTPGVPPVEPYCCSNLDTALDHIEALLAERDALIESAKAHFRDGKRLGMLEADEQSRRDEENPRGWLEEAFDNACDEKLAREVVKPAVLRALRAAREEGLHRVQRDAPAIRAAVRLAASDLRNGGSDVMAKSLGLLDANRNLTDLGRAVTALAERMEAEDG